MTRSSENTDEFNQELRTVLTAAINYFELHKSAADEIEFANVRSTDSEIELRWSEKRILISRENVHFARHAVMHVATHLAANRSDGVRDDSHDQSFRFMEQFVNQALCGYIVCYGNEELIEKVCPCAIKLFHDVGMVWPCKTSFAGQYGMSTLPKETPGVTALTRKKILVLDDGDFNRAVLRTILEDTFEVEEAGNSHLALKLVELWQPDLIIQDIDRPDMDGWEFLRELRKGHPSLPVIVVTAYSSELARRTSMEAGAFAHLTKPIDLEPFVQTVAQALASTKT